MTIAYSLELIRGLGSDLHGSRRNVGDMAQGTAASFEEFDQEMARAVKTILEDPA